MNELDSHEQCILDCHCAMTCGKTATIGKFYLYCYLVSRLALLSVTCSVSLDATACYGRVM